MSDIALFKIIYNEGDPNSVTGVNAFIPCNALTASRTLARMQIGVSVAYQGNITLLNKSSIDHFIMDGGHINIGEHMNRQVLVVLPDTHVSMLVDAVRKYAEENGGKEALRMWADLQRTLDSSEVIKVRNELDSLERAAERAGQ